jgi:hypothetical protein
VARRRLFTRSSVYDGGRGFGSAEMRNPERELFLFRRRLAVVAVLALLAFAGLFARFCYLQVVQHGHYATLAESNRIAIVPIVPNRGVITDRNGSRPRAKLLRVYAGTHPRQGLPTSTRRSTLWPRSSTCSRVIASAFAS